MKTIRQYLESLVSLFSLLILFQSCVVYEKSSVSLDWAAKQELRAKVEMKTSETYKFKRISFENEHYYGIKEIIGETTKTPLQADTLDKVLLQNKSASAVITIATVLGSLIAVLLIWYFIDTGGGNWLDLST